VKKPLPSRVKYVIGVQVSVEIGLYSTVRVTAMRGA